MRTVAPESARPWLPNGLYRAYQRAMSGDLAGDPRPARSGWAAVMSPGWLWEGAAAALIRDAGLRHHRAGLKALVRAICLLPGGPAEATQRAARAAVQGRSRGSMPRR